MAWTSPRTWLAGEKPSAATLNTHIRDNLKAIGDAWTSYTPTWSAATTNPVLGNGTMTGRYIAAGKLIIFSISLTMGSTTTFGSGVYTFSYPVAPFDSGNNGNAGITGFFYDASGTKPWSQIGVGQTTTAFRLLDTSSNSYSTNAFPIALANLDKIVIQGTYEAA